MSILLVEQNAKMALETAHYGYVLEVGRVVMDDTCERLMQQGHPGILPRRQGRRRTRRTPLESARRTGAEAAGRGGCEWHRRRAWPDRLLTVAETLPKSFVLSCTTRGDMPAMREKLYGIWTPISWTQWLQMLPAVTYALHAIGFRPGDVASVLANAVPEWNYADFGILCAGGVSSASTRPMLGQAGRVPAQRFRDDRAVRRGRRAARQGAGGAAGAARPCKQIVVFDMEGLRLFRSHGDLARRLHGRSAATTRRARRRCSTSWSQPHAGRSRHPGLYLGHHRAAQGRDARQPQCRLHQMRHAIVLISARRTTRKGWPSCRSAMSPNASPAATISVATGRDEFRREPGDRPGQYPRGAAHFVRRCRGSGKSSIPPSPSR